MSKKYLGPNGVPVLYEAIKDALTDMRDEVKGYRDNAEESATSAAQSAAAAAQYNYRITITGTKINFIQNS